MANSKLPIEATLQAEGSALNDDPNTGEYSRYGISAVFLQSVHREWAALTVRNYIFALTPAQATVLYQTYFWDRLRIGLLLDERLAAKVFDLAVNMGPGGKRAPGAITILQDAANDYAGERLIVDGILGAQSILAINTQPAAALYENYTRRIRERYIAIARNPKNARFLAGWLARLAKG